MLGVNSRVRATAIDMERLKATSSGQGTSATRSVVVRRALPEDVAAICGFGVAHIPSHYTPLIGHDAAQAQVTRWWSQERIAKSVGAGQVVVAEAGDELLGVAERGEWDGHPVIWKLYVHPDHRSKGIGPRLLQALVAQLPAGTERLQVEHFEANHRAGDFYEREGFVRTRTEMDPSQPALAITWRELDMTR